MKLYVHIGRGKTGSSAIQSFLNHNRRALADRHGILYPNTRGGPFDEGVCHNHSELVTQYPVEYAIEQIAGAIAFAAARGLRAVVLSSENDAQKYTDMVSRIVRRLDADPTVIVYLRRQDHLVEAAWKQWGMRRGAETFEEYVTSERQRFLALESPGRMCRMAHELLLEQWAAAIPKTAMVVRPYERAQLKDGDVVSDFLSLLGLDNRNGFEDPPETCLNQNHGFQPAVVELMRLSYGLSARPIDRLAQRLLYEALGSTQRKPPFGTYTLLSPAARRDLLELCDPMNQRIARTYLGRADGRLFLEPWPRGDEPWEPFRPEAKDLMPLLFQTLAHLIATRHHREQQLRALRGRMVPVAVDEDSACNDSISI